MGESLSSAENEPDGGANDGVYLSQLISLLSQRPRHTLLLSDLLALLPNTVRQRVKELGGLRSWLQQHGSIFVISGQPGKESVTLSLGGNAADADQSPQSAAGQSDEDPLAQSAVQLR